MRKRLLQPQLTVWHEYGVDVSVVPPEGRERFWDEAESRMRESVHSDFTGYEFKSDDGQVLLVVREDC